MHTKIVKFTRAITILILSRAGILTSALFKYINVDSFWGRGVADFVLRGGAACILFKILGKN